MEKPARYKDAKKPPSMSVCLVHGQSCRHKHTLRIHPEAGVMCVIAWFASPRCSCGSGLPIIHKETVCVRCYNTPFEKQTAVDFMAGQTALASQQGSRRREEGAAAGGFYQQVSDGYARIKKELNIPEASPSGELWFEEGENDE